MLVLGMGCRFSSWLALCSILLLGLTYGQGDQARIVQDVIAVGMLFSLMTPLISQDTNTSPCFKEVPNLAPCASDGSLQIKEGCCSQDCADRMKQALVTAGNQCYREFIQVLCNNTEIKKSLSAVLFNAADRCMGLKPSCDLLSKSGDLLPSGFEARLKGKDQGQDQSKDQSNDSSKGDKSQSSSAPKVVETSGNNSDSSSSSTPQTGSATKADTQSASRSSNSNSGNATDDRSRVRESVDAVSPIREVPGIGRRALLGHPAAAQTLLQTISHRQVSSRRRSLLQGPDLRAIFQSAGSPGGAAAALGAASNPAAGSVPTGGGGNPAAGMPTGAAGTTPGDAGALGGLGGGSLGGGGLGGSGMGGGAIGMGSPGAIAGDGNQDLRSIFQGAGQNLQAPDPGANVTGAVLAPGQKPPDLYAYTIPDPKGSLVLASADEIAAAAQANGTNSASNSTDNSGQQNSSDSSGQSGWGSGWGAGWGSGWGSGLPSGNSSHQGASKTSENSEGSTDGGDSGKHGSGGGGGDSGKQGGNSLQNGASGENQETDLKKQQSQEKLQANSGAKNSPSPPPGG